MPHQQTHRLANLSSVKLALLAKQAYAQVEDVLHAEPIAVIGMGCRFPGGAVNPAAYWQLLRNGVDATGEVPPDRWDADAWCAEDFAAPGKTNTRRGGFLRQIDGFDAAFFGISPREAERMDPQQRLMLEVAFEALEEAGLAHAALSGSRTGVFVASYHNDYTLRQYADPDAINLRTLTGTLHSIVANRISYLLNLRGPSLALDTACSSSLVAVHLACQSLRTRESDLCLAGGVSLMIHPAVNVALSKIGFISPDGRCYTFDSRAAGFSRGEGCGVVVLKRLADALADGDRVLALIRGSAINQDGHSTVLTAPNGRAQVAVIRAALDAAGLSPAQISHVEAHGTGTLLGDPIEVEALAEVMADGADTAGAKPGDPAPPCALTSVKTNLGHLEAAAGMAGLIKVVLSLQHEAIPPHLHLRELNPHISLDGSRLYIPTQLTPWPARAAPRFAGVSSFGVGGVNAHVVLGEAPAEAQGGQAPRRANSRPADQSATGGATLSSPDSAFARDAATGPYLLPISARSPAALAALAEQYAAWLEAGDNPYALADICAMAALRRNHYEQRLAVTGSTHAELAARLRQAVGRPLRGGATYRHTREAPPVLFVFSGQGPQWFAMGRELLAQEPVFRQEIERCDALLRPLAGWSLLAELQAPEDRSRLDQTEVAQPAIFALQMGLAALWRVWGIVPAAVVGHSIGEVAAACTAGSLSLEQAVTLVYHRSRLMQRATGGGQMASVELPAATVAARIAPYSERLSIAAINGPATTVLSGERDAVQAVLAELVQEQVSVRELKVNYAFHSAQMEGLAAELVGALASLAPQRAPIPIYSTVTGAPIDGRELDAAYWGRNMRRPVRFAEALAGAAAALAGGEGEAGPLVCLELSSHPVLSGVAGECLAAAGVEGVCLPSLRRGRPERESLFAGLGELYALGCAINWRELYAGPVRHVSLPLYPWQRERHWFEPAPLAGSVAAVPAAPAATADDLLGPPLRSPVLPGILFRSELSAAQPAWLGDHRIGGAALLPAAACITMALAAGRSLWPFGATLANLAIPAPLALPEEGRRVVQLHLLPDAGSPATGAAFQLFSSADEETWTLHAEGRLIPAADSAPSAHAASAHATPSRAELLARLPLHVDAPAHYDRLAQRGAVFGPSFRLLAGLWLGQGEAVAELVDGFGAASAADSSLSPAVLDAVLQPLTAVMAAGDPATAGSLYLPVGLDRLQVLRPAGTGLWSHLRLRPAPAAGDPARIAVCDITLFDAVGCVAELANVRFVRSPAAAQSGPFEQGGTPASSYVLDGDPSPADWLHVVAWRPQPLHDASQLLAGSGEPAGAGASAGPWLILAGADALGAALVEYLQAAGRRVYVALPGAAFARTEAAAWTIAPDQPEDYRRLLQAVCADAAAPLAGVVHLWSLDLPLLVEDALAAQEHSLRSLLYLAQALAAEGADRLACLLVATRNSQLVPPAAGAAAGIEAAPAVEQAPIWGLAASLARELPGLHPVCVDLDLLEPVDSQARQVGAELVAAERADGEGVRQVAWRGGQRLAGGLERLPLAVAEASPDPVQLAQPRRGLLDDLAVVGAGRRAPGPGEVEIHVAAAGLNFRDVLKALDQYPWDAGPLGDECAGEITAVGEGVRGLEVGQRVLAIAAGSMRTHVIARAELVAPLPADMSCAEGASIPIAFVTAAYTLQHVAGLRAGERVLIHAAAGGVGLAAVQIAQRLGAEVLATAGSESKRAYLRGLGVAQVFDSRSLSFAVGVREATGGRGVDVVLNSLAGEFIGASLDLLAPGGRFVEIGKSGLLTPHEAAALGEGRQYTAVFLADQFASEPQVIGALLRELLAGFAAGELRALPRRVFPFAAAPAAFRFMAQGRHIGKIVLTPPGDSAPAAGLFAPHATYLVAGGLGGIGQALVRQLAAWGARHLVLVGRRGADTPGAAALRASLERDGVRVYVAAVDLAEREQVVALLDELRREWPPLAGVIHAAGVLDDRIVLQQDWAHLRRVLAPKLQGAWNLHLLTQQVPLDFFVCFSGLAGWLGLAGQGGYAAANRFLPALAYMRRAQGLPALAIDWGPWRSVGMAAASGGEDGGASRWARLGLGMIDPAAGMAALRLALQQDRPHLAIAPMFPESAAQNDAGARAPAALGGTVNGAGARAPAALGGTVNGAGAQAAARPLVTGAERRAGLPQRYRQTPPSLQRKLLLDFIAEQAIYTIGLPADSKIDPCQPLHDIGLDSLMAVELRNLLSAACEQALPATLLFDCPTLAAVADYLQTHVRALAAGDTEVAADPGALAAPSAKATPGPEVRVDAAALAELTDAEAEALLLAELAALNGG